MAFELPQEELSTLQKIGQGMQAFGAGFRGAGQEFLAGQQQQQQLLSFERQKAAAEDMRRAKMLLDQGDVAGVRDLAANRIQNIQALGGDPSDTMAILGLADGALRGDQLSFDRLSTEINSGLQAAADVGLIKMPERAVPLSPEGKLQADIARGFVTPEQAAAGEAEEDRAAALREREIELSEAREQRMARALSASAEKALLESQDNVITRQRDANLMDSLANEFQSVTSGGVQAGFSEFLKTALGTEDEVSALRKRFNAIRSSQAVNNLPPGVASDKDIELALSGFPSANAGRELIQSFLRGAAKLARSEAAYSQFKSDFLSDKGTPRGLNRGWRESINAPALDRDVSMGEIYITAQEENMTPEEVMQQLGIER